MGDNADFKTDFNSVFEKRIITTITICSYMWYCS